MFQETVTGVRTGENRATTSPGKYPGKYPAQEVGELS